MDRATFETVRDVPGKVIRGDIRLVARKQTQPALVVENIVIENGSGVALRLNINYNPEVGVEDVQCHRGWSWTDLPLGC